MTFSGFDIDSLHGDEDYNYSKLYPDAYESDFYDDYEDKEE